jgi:hypothetical protein
VEISDFDEVRASGNLDVNLKKGDHVSAEFIAYGIDEDMIVIENKGNLLKAFVKPGFHGDFNVKVYITYTILREIKASSSARVYVRDRLIGDKINLNSNTGSLIDLEVSVNAIEADVDTGAEIKIKGKSEQLNASSGTGAVFSGYGFDTENAYLKAGTGGVIEVTVTDFIQASASTGGHIKYRGNPKKHKINESLGGSVSDD